MNRCVRFFLPVVFLLAFASVIAIGQELVQFKIPLSITVSAAPRWIDTLWMGVHGDGPNPPGTVVDNTYGIDVDGSIFGKWSEYNYPPDLQIWGPVSKFVQIPFRTGTPPIGIAGTGQKPYDFRGFTSPAQIDTYCVNVYDTFGPFGSVADGSVTLSWPAGLSNFAPNWELKRQVSGTNYTTAVSNMGTGAGSFTDDSTSSGNVRYLIIKTGAKQPPEGFSFFPSAIDFWVVAYPQAKTIIAGLTNTSQSRSWNISSITSTNPAFSVSPAGPMTISPFGFKNLTVTFIPPAGIETSVGNLILSGDTTISIPMIGRNICQCPSLSFTAPTLSVLDNSYAGSGYYSENINLSNYSGAPLKALQFTLVSRGKVITHKLEKAPAVSNWQLSTNVMRGKILPDGSSIDSINVVLWATGNEVYEPTSFSEPLLTFGYDVINITKDQDTTSFELLKILGSTSAFSDAMLNTNSTETIIINNRIQRGDVNNDDRVDILDLLAIVDHITGKAPLTGDAFTAADVAPWPTGDGSVDVRDLAQVQSIILNNQYPDGNPLLQVPKKTLASGELQKNAAAKLIIHVDPRGRELGFEIEGMGVRGLQVDMLNIKTGGSATEELIGQASRLDGNTLRVLVKSTEAFPVQSVVARIPATFRAADVQYANLMVVGEDLKAMNYEASIVYDIARDASLPDAYSLEQNYPNPFNPTTRITYAVKETGLVRIAVYNILGQEVAVLVNQEKAAGRYTIDWNGTGSTGNILSTGIYIYRMTAGNFVETRKMLFLK